MKTSAITRIILYSVLAIVLLSILINGVADDMLIFDEYDTEVTQGNADFHASSVSNLSIDWVAGNITVLTADTDRILVEESGKISKEYTMACEIDDDTLEIAYADDAVHFGFGSIPEKDLLITVPKDWVCNELELDVAGVAVNISNVAANSINCDGAGVQLSLDLLSNTQKIDIDGAGCEIRMTMPASAGYLAQMEGLGCDFDSNMNYSRDGDYYTSGNENCKVYVDGAGCSLTIDLQ